MEIRGLRLGEALCYQAVADGGDSCPGGCPGLSWVTGSLAQLDALRSHCLGAFRLRGSPADLDFELLLCDLHEACSLFLSLRRPLCPLRALPCSLVPISSLTYFSCCSFLIITDFPLHVEYTSFYQIYDAIIHKTILLHTTRQGKKTLFIEL